MLNASPVFLREAETLFERQDMKIHHTSVFDKKVDGAVYNLGIRSINFL